MNNNQHKKRGVATNSILLAFVQCLTMITSILQTMILSRELTKVEYGTYSQGLLVINFVMPFLMLGLSNAITYFSGQNRNDKQKYVNTIVTMVLCLGCVGTICIFGAQSLILPYFGNEGLTAILPFVAFLPLLLNMISVFQTLFVAEDMATSIAIRNAIVAVLQIIIVAISVFFLHDIRAIFIMLIILDCLQIALFSIVFRTRRYSIHLQLIEKEVAKEVLRYSIPLAFSTAIGTLSVYMDKLLIGRMTSVEDFALYTNMAKELPLAFIVGSFTTVIMPSFIRLHANGQDRVLANYWKKYLELGICITWILCGTAIFCSRDLLLFLYSEKYSRGIAIFIVYLVCELCRFSYFGIILSAFGKTKIIMYSSALSLICNFVLNIVLFRMLGMIGPAIASLASIILVQLLQIGFSCRLLSCQWREIFHFRFLIKLATEIIIIGIIVNRIGSCFIAVSFLRLVLCGGVMVLLVGALNYKRVMSLIRDINSL